ncbi:histidine kinase [Devosia geojensis]|uniref:Blue-light-activated histidine kinase n=1 Tax=Devosia geojensis TaxID=443610 RepID=A0A0F5FTF0_9HYPH|nr:PAS domain S-box protein [Devosia geojensis]KKB11860.1 histidine kinase [Devosia geojensis]
MTLADGAPAWAGTSAAVLEALPIAVYLTDCQGAVLAYNPAARELWGVEPQIGVAKWCGSWKLRFPDGSPMAHDECPMAVAIRENRAIRGGEAMAERPNGELVPFLAFPTPIRNENGELTGAVNALVEISDAQAAKRAQRHLAAIVAFSHDAIVSKDLGGIVTTWNESAERVFGYTADEVVGHPITILIPPERQHEEVEILSRIRAGEVVDYFETVRLHKDGRRMPVSLTISPIRGNDGAIVGISKIARDITEQKEAEQRIRTLMREVNHRVKNQFAVILSMVRETRTRTPDPEEFETQVRDRIMALSRSHDLLVKGEWRGATLFELLLAHIEIFGNQERVRLSGPTIMLQPMALQYIGMAFHELATNAVKYGALSGADGTIAVDWTIEPDRRFRLTWAETMPNPAPARRKANGFGAVVLERVAPAAVGGRGILAHTDAGISWTLTAPLEGIETPQDPDFGLENRGFGAETGETG